MSNRILITGSNGFLGRSFLNLFTAPGYEVVPLVGARGEANGTTRRLDLTDRASLRGVLREVQPTHILNFASRGVTRDQSTLTDLLAVNAIGAVNLVEALMEEGLAPQTYCFGTAYEYGDSDQTLNESAPLDPKSPYAISKTTQYFALKQFAGGAPLTFLRLFNVFGAGEPSERLIPFIARKARAGEPIPLTGGAQQRDFMPIGDLITILGRLVSSAPNTSPGLRTLNVGTGQGIELKTFIEYVGGALARRGLRPDLRFGDLPYRSQDPMRCVADNAALRTALGELSFTDLQTAVDHTVEALHEH